MRTAYVCIASYIPYSVHIITPVLTLLLTLEFLLGFMLRSSFVPSQIHHAFTCSVLPSCIAGVFPYAYAFFVCADIQWCAVRHPTPWAPPQPMGRLPTMLQVPREVPDAVVRSLHRAFSRGLYCVLILSVSRMLPRTVMSPTPNVIGQLM